MVVSDDAFNQNSDRISVVPLTHYWDEKEDSIARWACVVMPGDTQRGFTILTAKGGPARRQPEKRTYPAIPYFDERELITALEYKLAELRLKRLAPSSPWKKSLVDCGRIWTVFCVPQDSGRAAETHPTLGRKFGYLDDIQWKFDRARMTTDGMFNIDCALQLLLADDIRLLECGVRADDTRAVRQEDLPFQQGDVVKMDIPGAADQHCVVVSSTSVDYLRSRIHSRETDINFQLITVVPLIDESPVQPIRPGVVTIGGRQLSAECTEPYTLYWPPRRATRVTELEPDSLRAVLQGLRYYLGLPKLRDSRGKLSTTLVSA